MDFDGLELIHDEKIGYYNIKSPLDISGGYLIEKEYGERLHIQENAYFITNAELGFSLKNPKKASKDEVEYVAKFFQNIEDLLQRDKADYKEYLDEESFARQFLIDKITLEADAMTASTFFYIDKDEGVLKSGPLWDYDRAMGWGEPDYTLPIEGWPGEMSSWYNHLYHDKEFKEKILGYYLKLLPYMEDLLSGRIDEYAEWIAASRKMDKERWGYTGENFVAYLEYSNNIRYLKYFIINRLEYLNNEWGISYDFNRYKNWDTDAVHIVTLQKDDGRIIATFEVKDGECIERLPDLETACGRAWYFNYSNIKQSDKIPVFESVTFTYR